MSSQRIEEIAISKHKGRNFTLGVALVHLMLLWTLFPSSWQLYYLRFLEFIDPIRNGLEFLVREERKAKSDLQKKFYFWAFMYILGRFDWDEENKCMKEKFPKLLNIDQPTNYKEYCEAIKIFKRKVFTRTTLAVSIHDGKEVYLHDMDYVALLKDFLKKPPGNFCDIKQDFPHHIEKGLPFVLRTNMLHIHKGSYILTSRTLLGWFGSFDYIRRLEAGKQFPNALSLIEAENKDLLDAARRRCNLYEGVHNSFYGSAVNVIGKKSEDVYIPETGETIHRFTHVVTEGLQKKEGRVMFNPTIAYVKTLRYMTNNLSEQLLERLFPPGFIEQARDIGFLDRQNCVGFDDMFPLNTSFEAPNTPYMQKKNNWKILEPPKKDNKRTRENKCNENSEKEGPEKRQKLATNTEEVQQNTAAKESQETNNATADTQYYQYCEERYLEEEGMWNYEMSDTTIVSSFNWSSDNVPIEEDDMPEPIFTIKHSEYGMDKYLNLDDMPDLIAALGEDIPDELYNAIVDNNGINEST